ncbi:MAG: AbrB family transcriptional regulator [Coleofasciculus sp. B1-GNL1-01]|uniref:AbrB family transcriptional regulator n=1 Tax=Coleofasciculus sp. B1-GNL1-01 TaxID=3068484 RepID=UPI0032F5328E
MVWQLSSLPESPSIPNQDSLYHWRKKLVDKLPQIKTITPQIIAAIGVGLLFSWLHVPVGWLLGPMLVGIGYAIRQGSRQPLPSSFKLIGQIVVGLVTATRFSPETISVATTYAVPLLLCVLLTGSLSLFNGYLLSRWAGIDRTTSLLGFIPGAASSIVVMSEEMGADAIAVALLQYIRVLLVVLIMPSAAILLVPANPDTLVTATVAPASTLTTLPLALSLLILAGCGILGIWAGKRFRLPSPGFFGPFLVGLAAFWALPNPVQMPQPLFAGGLLLIGLSVGVQFDWQTARKLFKAVLIEIGLVTGLIIICLGIGYGFHCVTGVDMATAILGFTPGGIEAMVATVMQLGGDTGLVLAMQLTRMLSIIMIAPWLVAFLVKRANAVNDQSYNIEPVITQEKSTLKPDFDSVPVGK